MSVCISCLIIHKMLLETVYFSIAKDIWRLSMKINRGLIKNQLISLRYRAPNLISLNNLATASGSKHSHSSDIVRIFFFWEKAVNGNGYELKGRFPIPRFQIKMNWMKCKSNDRFFKNNSKT